MALRSRRSDRRGCLKEGKVGPERAPEHLSHCISSSSPWECPTVNLTKRHVTKDASTISFTVLAGTDSTSSKAGPELALYFDRPHMFSSHSCAGDNDQYYAVTVQASTRLYHHSDRSPGTYDCIFACLDTCHGSKFYHRVQA